MKVDIIEVPALVPGEYPLVEHRVRDGECFKDSRSVLPDAVPDGQQAVFRIEDAVHIDLPGLHLLLEVVFLSCRLVEGCVPFVEFADCRFGGVRIIEGVEPWPVYGVTRILERIPDKDMCEGVLYGNVVLVSERVCIFQ